MIWFLAQKFLQECSLISLMLFVKSKDCVSLHLIDVSVFISSSSHWPFISVGRGPSSLTFLGSGTSHLGFPFISLAASFLSTFLPHSPPPPFIKCWISSRLSPRPSSPFMHYVQEIIINYDFSYHLHVSGYQLTSPAQTVSLCSRPRCPTTY